MARVLVMLAAGFEEIEAVGTSRAIAYAMLVR